MEQTDTQPKNDSQLEIERYKASEQQILELLRATIAFEHAALKPMPLLNGGALVAALTFAGHVAGGAGKGLLNFGTLKFALLLWGAGLVVSVAAVFLGYFSQFYFLKGARRRRDNDEIRRSGRKPDRTQRDTFDTIAHNVRTWAYVATSGSLALFCIGVASAIAALNSAASTQ